MKLTNYKTFSFLLLFLGALQIPAQKVVGYWPYYRSGLSTINYSNYTDMVYAFLNPTTSGDLNFSDGKFSQSAFNQMVSLCNSNKVRAHISIGGANLSDKIAAVAGNASARSKFITQIVSFVAGKHSRNSNPIAGVDIDWEFPTTTTEKNNHYNLVKELKAALTAEGAKDGRKYELAIAVGGSTPNMPRNLAAYHSNYFKKEVLNEVDYVYIMNYDLGSSGYSGSHHSPYQGCVDAFTYYTTTLGVTPGKIIMGIPFYARDPWGGAFTWKSMATAANYTNATGMSGNKSFNSKTVIDQKVSYLCKNGAGGALVWEIWQDHSSASLSLGKALMDAFVANNCAPDNTGGGSGGGSGGTGGTTDTDCITANGFNEDFKTNKAPTDGIYSIGYWGDQGPTYQASRSNDDLDIKVTQAKNGWLPMGFSVNNSGGDNVLDISGNSKVEVSLTNEGSTGIEVYFTFVSNNNNAQLVTSSDLAILFGGIVPAGATMNQTFDLSNAKKHQYVGATGNCAGGTHVDNYCLTNTGFDPSKLSGVEWSINGEGATVNGQWAQPAITNHPVKIHYIRAGVACSGSSSGGGGNSGGGNSGGGSSSSVEEFENKGLVLFPNPASELLQVSYSGSVPAKVSMTDLSGKIVFNGTINSNTDVLSVNTSSFRKGMYFVNVNSTNNSAIKKVVIK